MVKQERPNADRNISPEKWDDFPELNRFILSTQAEYRLTNQLYKDLPVEQTDKTIIPEAELVEWMRRGGFVKKDKQPEESKSEDSLRYYGMRGLQRIETG